MAPGDQRSLTSLPEAVMYGAVGEPQHDSDASIQQACHKRRRYLPFTEPALPVRPRMKIHARSKLPRDLPAHFTDHF